MLICWASQKQKTEKKISIDYAKTEDQLADILTKSLGRQKFVEIGWQMIED
ncbi:unnamed protein product [Spirodela intermedia]|uniref:Uncharacterized protein n=1 Tax=Spirodela intermedia TaxID=51605 RepID=A0A7I8IEA0_SPIIN|nr:unnamed protein product [Spirodela intermedia]CAA6656118.1 unnamed protein product [Spirodela intermedia]